MVGLNRGVDNFSQCPAHLLKAYRTLSYRVTKALLSPVLDAVADTISEVVRESVKDGVRTALSPSELLFGRRKN